MQAVNIICCENFKTLWNKWRCFDRHHSHSEKYELILTRVSVTLRFLVALQSNVFQNNEMTDEI